MDANAVGLQLIRVEQGELRAEITAACAQLGISQGAVVSLIGAVDGFTVSTMPADDPTKDVVTDYDLPAEMTGSGEIVDGVPHLHVVMAVEGDRAVAGHLHRARVGAWFARVYVQALG